jgi:hypothetical protein
MNACADSLSLAPLRPLANKVRKLASAVDHPDGARWLRELAAELEDSAGFGANLISSTRAVAPTSFESMGCINQIGAGMPQDRDSGGSEVPGSTVPARARLLREAQRNEIIAAIEKAGLDPSAFDLTDDGAEVQVKHRLSASCFTLYRDKTWRYVGTHFVGHGTEKPFDRSWQTVIPLISLWLAEVKGGDHGEISLIHSVRR